MADLVPRQIVEHLAILVDVSREVGSSVDLGTLLERIEQATLRIVECDRVTVFLFDPVRNELRSRLATGETELTVPMNCGLAGECFRTRKVLNTPDVSTDPRFYSAVDESTGYRTRSLLSVPLIGYDRKGVGVLQLVNKKEGAFTAADEEMATTLASLTAVALQRQMLLEEHGAKEQMERTLEKMAHDLETARKIQRSLLPQIDPVIQGFDIAGWNLAADVTGGDFYDYLNLSEGRLGLVLSDVSGHGLASSLMACETRALVRAIASLAPDLQTIVTRTNSILHRDLSPERFVTMFLGDLNVSTGELRYVSAGHAPLLVCPGDGRGWRRMDSTTPPLGILRTIDARPSPALTMKRGDVLALVTDGFDEWTNADEEEFGIERLAQVIGSNRERPARDLIGCLHQAVVSFAGGTPQVDDLTALIIRRL